MTTRTVIDAVFGGTFSVWSIPDEYRGRSAILVHEYDDTDRLRHVQWLDPAAAVELGHRLIETAQPLTNAAHDDDEARGII